MFSRLFINREGANNRLFSCQLLDEKRVVVRLYGSSLTDEGTSHRFMDEETELAVVTKLSEKGLYPRVLASFLGGRIEDFIHGRCITLAEANDHKVMNPLMMRKIAQIHSIKDVSMKAEPVFEVMQSFLDGYMSIKDSMDLQSNDKIVYDEVTQTNFAEEKQWLNNIFKQIQTRNVFSHSDFQKGNILLLQHDANNNAQPWEVSLQDIFVMDYEYSGLNVRWGDLAYYFCNISCASYDPVTDKVEYPSIDRKTMAGLIDVYLTEWKLHNSKDIDQVIDSTEHILLEVTFGRLIVHMMVILFFLSFVRKNYDKVHCWKYIRHRMQCYFQEKESFLSLYPYFA